MIIFTQQYLHNQKYQNTEIDLGYPYSVPKQSSMRNHQRQPSNPVFIYFTSVMRVLIIRSL